MYWIITIWYYWYHLLCVYWKVRIFDVLKVNWKLTLNSIEKLFWNSSKLWSEKFIQICAFPLRNGITTHWVCITDFCFLIFRKIKICLIRTCATKFCSTFHNWIFSITLSNVSNVSKVFTVMNKFETSLSFKDTIRSMGPSYLSHLDFIHLYLCFLNLIFTNILQSNDLIY